MKTEREKSLLWIISDLLVMKTPGNLPEKENHAESILKKIKEHDTKYPDCKISEPIE